MARKFVFIILAALTSIVWTGCVERSLELSASEREQVAPYILSEAPSPQHALSADFEGKIELLGYDVSVEEITPGQPFTITWYWKCNQALESGWGLFTHVASQPGVNRHNADGQGLIRELYQPGRWRRGEIVRDVQEITLPADWGSREAIFYIGLWKDSFRLQVDHPQAEEDNRLRAATLRVGAAAAPPPANALPRLPAQRTTDTITIDGRLNEMTWTNSRPTRSFVNTMDGSEATFRARARTAWDDENLYIAFDVNDRFLKSEFDDQDDHLWNQDCVEVMVDPGGQGQNYFELQVSPRGVTFDTRYDRRRVPGPHGHVDWDSDVRAAVQTRGEVNDGDEDQGYTVEMAIPWAAFNTGTPAYSRPSAGDSWRLNFYVMDSREDGPQHFAAWSPPRVGDFHMPPRFGHIAFQGDTPALPRIVPGIAPPPSRPTSGSGAVPASPTQIQQVAPGLRLNSRLLDRDTVNVGRTLDDAERRTNERPAGSADQPVAAPTMN